MPVAVLHTLSSKKVLKFLAYSSIAGIFRQSVDGSQKVKKGKVNSTSQGVLKTRQTVSFSLHFERSSRLISG